MSARVVRAAKLTAGNSTSIGCQVELSFHADGCGSELVDSCAGVGPHDMK